MKLTKEQLRRIIKEELEAILNEDSVETQETNTKEKEDGTSD